jgi:hypothetical protein
MNLWIQIEIHITWQLSTGLPRPDVAASKCIPGMKQVSNGQRSLVIFMEDSWDTNKLILRAETPNIALYLPQNLPEGSQDLESTPGPCHTLHI